MRTLLNYGSLSLCSTSVAYVVILKLGVLCGPVASALAGGGGGECAAGCPEEYVGDDWCDPECYNTDCAFDGGDCGEECAPGCPEGFLDNGECNPDCNNAQCEFDHGECDECAPGCPEGYVDDDECDPQCYNADCALDGGDCGEECASGCPEEFIGDLECNPACNNAGCEFDGGDCTSGCPEILLQSVSPASGTIDAGQPSDPSCSNAFGIGSPALPIVLQINSGDPSSVSCWSLCESPASGDATNTVVSVQSIGGNQYRVSLTQPIRAGKVTTLRYAADNGSGFTLRYIAHPGNANGDSIASPSDILSLLNHLNGFEPLPFGLYSGDIDRSGAINPADVLRLIDLLNGAECFDSWNTTPLPQGCSESEPPCFPAHPSNLVASNVTTTSVVLTWTDGSTNETSFRIARLDPGEDPNNFEHWDNDGVVGANQTTFMTTGLTPNSTYMFRVRAANDCGYSGYTNDVIVTTDTCLTGAPSNLVAFNVATTSVVLSWTDGSTNETSFRIARLDPGEDPNNFEHWDNVGVVGANQTTFTATGLSPNSTYMFRVRAANDCGYSAYTNDVTVTTSICQPSAPSNLGASNVTTNSVVLTWTDGSNNETSFRIARLDPGEDPNNFDNWDNVGTAAANQTTFTATGLSPNSTYMFRVRAANDCGYSAYTNDVTVTTAAPVCDPPPAPFDCIAARKSNTPQADPILITWNYVGIPVDGFRVARLELGEDPNDPDDWDNVGGDLLPTDHFYCDSWNLHNGQTVWYKVRAFVDTPCGKIYSDYSNIDPANP